MNVLGVKITHHDTGAALISDGRIIAIAEERLNRVKHSFNMFPKLAISYCLDVLKVMPNEIDLVVMDQVDLKDTVPMEDIFKKETGDAFCRARLRVINHHDSHAASAFFCSRFDEAGILVYDGSGEKFKTHLGVAATETETLYRGAWNRLYQIQKTMHSRERRIYPYTYGIGKLYAFFSKTYIGFGSYNEGKMMGLAPYGTDALLQRFPENYWFREKDGHILCNARIDYPRLVDKRTQARGIKGTMDLALHLFKMRTRDLRRSWARRFSEFVYRRGTFIEPELFPKFQLPHSRRDPSVKLPDEYYTSCAYACQKILEKIAFLWGSRLKNVTRSENLCIAGGVGLNIDANKLFLDKVGFKHIFIQPGASDTGVPLGCALYGWHVILDRPRFWVMKSAELGKRYCDEEIRAAIEKTKNEIEWKKSTDIAKETANLIKDGRIIGWFQGGSEYGPRALGNRSILCDARIVAMRDTLNDKVKHREPWRPFAASVLLEKMTEWFDLEEESPFMLLAAPVREEKRKIIPAVVHVDGTCRIQSVTREANGPYYDLIWEFNQLTGVPLILNTSFNLGGDPIVETPEDALNCFLATQMDFLVLEDYVISKRQTT